MPEVKTSDRGKMLGKTTVGKRQIETERTLTGNAVVKS